MIWLRYWKLGTGILLLAAIVGGVLYYGSYREAHGEANVQALWDAQLGRDAQALADERAGRAEAQRRATTDRTNLVREHQNEVANLLRDRDHYANRVRGLLNDLAAAADDSRAVRSDGGAEGTDAEVQPGEASVARLAGAVADARAEALSNADRHDKLVDYLTRRGVVVE